MGNGMRHEEFLILQRMGRIIPLPRKHTSLIQKKVLAQALTLHIFLTVI